MTGLIIAGAVLLAIFLLLQLRAGVLVRFDASGLMVRVRIGFLRLTVFPPRKQAKRGKHPAAGKREKPKKKEAEEPETGGAWEQFLLYLRIGADAAARLRRKLRIDILRLDILWAARDPAAAALGYGTVSAMLSAAMPLLDRAFDVRERAIRTAVDFEGTSPTVFGTAACSMTIGQGLMFALSALTQYLNGKKKIRKEAVSK